MATLPTLVGRVPKKVNWNVTVLVDGIALKRGYPSGGEVCEIPGIGMVDVAWVRSLLDDAVVDVLVHDLHDIRAYGTLTRHQPRPVKVAVAARDRRCVVPGCRRMRRCQIDHRHDHAKGGPTQTPNLELLCQHHHNQKTHQGARLERTATEWHWYPPPPAGGEPEPPPGSIPWRAPIGEHLPTWDLDHLPGQTPRPPRPLVTCGADAAGSAAAATLPLP